MRSRRAWFPACQSSTRCCGIGIPALVILVFWLRNETVIMVALAALIYFWNKQRTAIRNKTTASYVENFLLPVLHEVIPNAEVDYNGGIEKRILKVVTPRAESYSPNCHIMFNDERRTEFCNLWASPRTCDRPTDYKTPCCVHH